MDHGNRQDFHHGLLESQLHRHCHILDRNQLESLISANLVAARPIIAQAFTPEEAEHILNYFRTQAGRTPLLTADVSAPSSVLAGEPFHIRVELSQSSICNTRLRLRWMTPSQDAPLPILVSPVDVDQRGGFKINFQLANAENPFILEQDIEFLLYAVGPQALGKIEVLTDDKEPELIFDTKLPSVYVVENLCPPFYQAPYSESMDIIRRGCQRAQSGKVTCVAIAGAGGAGKTRLCKEMCLDARRAGAYVVSARQAHSAESPRRILANLLLALTETGAADEMIADRIDIILAQLAPKLAASARSAIEALCGRGTAGSFEDDQALLSVFAVLIAQRGRFKPVIIHLHDLHWCTADVLELIDQLIWQLEHLKIQSSSLGRPSGIPALFLLEGRLHEHRQDSSTGWSTRMFEDFIDGLGCPIAHCRAFESEESLTFARRLFEQAHTAQRLLPRSLLEVQDQLIDSIHRAAGGNPLHILEQVKPLQQHRILDQNPKTGFVYMIRPNFGKVHLPSNILATIGARWKYYWINHRPTALLLWAAALVDDDLPSPLFRCLWSRLAPGVSQATIESTEFLRFPQSDEEGQQVSFRHESYFQTVRRIQLSEADRCPVVEAYADWFRGVRGLSPALQYARAKVELEAPKPNLKKVRRILHSAQRQAIKSKDHSLLSRVLATLLDGLTWPSDERKPLPKVALLRACEDETTLCTLLVRSGQTDVAYKRLQKLLKIIEVRLRRHVALADRSFDPLLEQRFILQTMQADILAHDRRPAEAVAITDKAVRELDLLTSSLDKRARQPWRKVTMEVRHTHSAAVAFAGDMTRAVDEARIAARMAESLLDDDPRALEVMITSANILLSRTPEQSESTLERYSTLTERSSVEEGTRIRLQINLAMARILLGYRDAATRNRDDPRLRAARESLTPVFNQAYVLGRLKDAAATALLLGLIHALWSSEEEVRWFSQATALSIRSRQLETLWRAHINLAHAYHRCGRSACDSAAAALDIMAASLNSYPEPDRNPRFDLLAVPMAHAVRYLLLEQAERAQKALREFPALRRVFSNLAIGELKEDRGGWHSHEWFRIGSADYVLY